MVVQRIEYELAHERRYTIPQWINSVQLEHPVLQSSPGTVPELANERLPDPTGHCL
jgi:hypothetical protein